MFNEIRMIGAVADKKTRIALYTDSLAEYYSWLQHVLRTGRTWVAGGEETGAEKEATKIKAHIKMLKNAITAEMEAI